MRLPGDCFCLRCQRKLISIWEKCSNYSVTWPYWAWQEGWGVQGRSFVGTPKEERPHEEEGISHQNCPTFIQPYPTESWDGNWGRDFGRFSGNVWVCLTMGPETQCRHSVRLRCPWDLRQQLIHGWPSMSHMSLNLCFLIWKMDVVAPPHRPVLHLRNKVYFWPTEDGWTLAGQFWFYTFSHAPSATWRWWVLGASYPGTVPRKMKFLGNRRGKKICIWRCEHLQECRRRKQCGEKRRQHFEVSTRKRKSLVISLGILS